MIPGGRSVSPAHHAPRGAIPAAGGPPPASPVNEDARACLAALRATGASLGEAVLSLAEAMGQEVALAALVELLPPPKKGLKVSTGRRSAILPARAILDEVAKGDPALAHLGLLGWIAKLGGEVRADLFLRERPWALPLPNGLTVTGDLELSHLRRPFALPEGLTILGNLSLCSTRIETLPDSLSVGKNLTLINAPIVSLPANLSVGLWLTLRDCTHWDGRIPKDLSLEGCVVTDLHPQGLPLREWRDLHPLGEKP